MREGFQFPRTYEMRQQVALDNGNYEALAARNVLAKFSCKHRITKRHICAIPCNGISEMCENDEDEQCAGVRLEIILAATLVFSMLFVTSAFLIDYVALTKSQNECQDVIVLDSIENTERHDMNIFKNRLSMHYHGLNFLGAIKLAEKCYNEWKSGTEQVDEKLMHDLGTNELTVFFYDCVDQSMSITVGSFLQIKTPMLFLIITKFYLQNVKEIVNCVFSMSIKYSDLPKDILFLYIIWNQLGNYSFNSFPMVIFWILLSSIIAVEILHCLTIIMYHSKYTGRRAIILVLTPIMPAFYLYEYLKLTLMINKTWRRFHIDLQVDNEKINKYKSKCEELQLLSAEIHCTENILENLTQLTILIMIMSLSITTTRAVENIESTFVKQNALLGYALVILSFLSILKGQLTFLKANKNGCLGLIGTMIVTPYFILGTFSR